MSAFFGGLSGLPLAHLWSPFDAEPSLPCEPDAPCECFSESLDAGFSLCTADDADVSSLDAPLLWLETWLCCESLCCELLSVFSLGDPEPPWLETVSSLLALLPPEPPWLESLCCEPPESLACESCEPPLARLDAESLCIEHGEQRSEPTPVGRSVARSARAKRVRRVLRTPSWAPQSRA